LKKFDRHEYYNNTYFGTDEVVCVRSTLLGWAYDQEWVNFATIKERKESIQLNVWILFKILYEVVQIFKKIQDIFRALNKIFIPS
jgi:hypothetical protein